MTEYRDLLGQEIKTGSYIAYTVRDGDRATMRLGKVLKLQLTKDTITQRAGNQCLLVYALDKSYGRTWTPMSKLIKLTIFERIVVLDQCQIPILAQDFFNTITVETSDKKC